MFIKREEAPIIISVGGSLIVPNGGADTIFLSKLNKLIRSEVIKGRRFMLVAGGGRIARHYRDAGKEVIGDLSDEDLDWLGIHATRLNAHLLRTIFQDIANPRIVINYEKKISDWKEPVAIGAGWKPGWSTDYCAVILAREYHSNIIINLSNIDGVYDSDPNKFKNAKLIKKITWEGMEKLVGDKWSPGLNTPFDPVSTQLAKRLGLTAIVASGKDFVNLENIIDGEPFEGTVIMPYHIDSGFYNRDYFMGKRGGHKFGFVESIWGIFFHNFVGFLRALMIKLTINPKTCLDVGCGTGILVKWMRFFGIEATGLDFSNQARELATQEVKKHIKVGDVAEIPFDSNSFDLVISVNLFQHLERSKIKKAIKETIRVSKRLIIHKIYTPENIWYRIFHNRDFSHISFFYKKHWENLFSNFENVTLVNKKIRIPTFIETQFILRKKNSKT